MQDDNPTPSTEPSAAPEIALEPRSFLDEHGHLAEVFVFVADAPVPTLSVNSITAFPGGGQISANLGATTEEVWVTNKALPTGEGVMVLFDRRDAEHLLGLMAMPNVRVKSVTPKEVDDWTEETGFGLCVLGSQEPA